MDSSKTRAYTNKYNSLTSEDIAKLFILLNKDSLQMKKKKSWITATKKR
ncbi:MAG: hypothetical protein IJJ47_02725 [Methanosphaera sp.]|nr:hypothetical protein [Methanosphaera sp.]